MANKKTIMESKWKMNLATQNHFVGEKYMMKTFVKTNQKRIARFNFKLFHNLLPNNIYLSKWNKHIDKQCTYCQKIEKQNI